MPNCAACGKSIPYRDMQSKRGPFGGHGSDDIIAAMGADMSAATSAWKCDRCGDWICNDCVCSLVVGHQAGGIQHSNCGGTFRSP